MVDGIGVDFLPSLHLLNAIDSLLSTCSEGLTNKLSELRQRHDMHVALLNRIQGKYMLENKKLSDRERVYGYQNDERTITCVIVNRDSNEKQVFKAGDNIVIDVTTPALKTSQRVMPMLGVERQSARWHGWVVTRMPTTLTLCLVCLNRL